MRKCFGWVKVRPMYSNEDNLKRTNFDHRLNLMQEVKAKYFRNLDEQNLYF